MNHYNYLHKYLVLRLSLVAQKGKKWLSLISLFMILRKTSGARVCVCVCVCARACVYVCLCSSSQTSKFGMYHTTTSDEEIVSYVHLCGGQKVQSSSIICLQLGYSRPRQPLRCSALGKERDWACGAGSLM